VGLLATLDAARAESADRAGQLHEALAKASRGYSELVTLRARADASEPRAALRIERALGDVVDR
jgi:hypothetical protein